MPNSYLDVNNPGSPDTAVQAIALARTNATRNSSALILLALALCAGMISGCKKKATDYASVVAGMHQWSGIKIDHVYDTSRPSDTSYVTLSTNIVGMNNSSIAFANPIPGSGFDPVTLKEIAADAKTIMFYFGDAPAYLISDIYDSLIYNYSSKTIYWHAFQYYGNPSIIYEEMILHSP